jgi:hypothetical protein
LLFNTPGGHPMRRARRALWFLFQPAAQGALPTLYAATAPEAEGGAYYGPDGPAELRGHPQQARIPRAALTEADAARLWKMSEDLTGVQFPGAPRKACLA